MRSFGPAAVLCGETVPDPAPPPGWVTVRLRAAALNWHDVLVREGRYGSVLPHVPGADGAGVRADTGEDVIIVPSLGWGGRDAAPAPGWQILGDRVAGTYAEQVSVPADCLAPRPPGWSWAEAAGLPLVGLTGYRALVSRGRLRAGESVLVLGAGGGLPVLATALAVALGAEVWVTSGRTEKLDRARDLGARGGVLYTDADWPAAARDLSPDGAGFDLVLDPAGCWAQAVSAVRPGGRVVVLGATQGEHAQLDVRSFYFGQFDLLGTTMGSPRDFAGLMSLVAAGKLRPLPLDQAFPLDAAADAHARLESGDAFGKITLTVG
jgi:zinc-binding alcohol dehydrogenase/oxidoreductase